MDSAVVVVLVVGFFGLTGPLTLAYVTGRQARLSKAEDAEIRKREKEQDYRRQDLVAERVEKAAKELARSQALLLDSNNEVVKQTTVVADQTRDVGIKLDVIHTLVNSDLTKAVQGQLDAVLDSLIYLREVAGARPSAAHVAQIKTKEARIAELRAELNERARAAGTVDAQLAAAGMASVSGIVPVAVKTEPGAATVATALETQTKQIVKAIQTQAATPSEVHVVQDPEDPAVRVKTVEGKP